MSNQLTTNRERLLTLFDGIFLGRTLHDLEKEAGASIEALLKAVRDDEEAFLDFKANREWGTFVQESELTTKLRQNAAEDAPSPARTNALKLYADHLHWVMERANPGYYSGKVNVTASVPLKIITTLDLNNPKQIDNVYDLTATIETEKDRADVTDIEVESLEARALEAPGGSPFDAAVGAVRGSQSIEEAASRLEAMLAADAGRPEGEAPEERPAALGPADTAAGTAAAASGRPSSDVGKMDSPKPRRSKRKGKRGQT